MPFFHRNPVHRRLPWLLAVAALLSACSTSFTYNRLDWLIPWYVDGYVDLNRDQRDVLRGQLEPVLRWHRSEELLRYVQILDGIERDLSRPVDAATVSGWVDEVVAAAGRTETSMLGVALGFGASLSAGQMREFVASLDEQQAEYEDEFLSRSDADYVRENHESLVDFLEGLLGRLEESQQSRLREAAGALRRFDAAWLEERAAWLATLEPLLLERPPGWQQEVEKAYAARRETRTPRYHEFLAHNLAALTPAVADVLNARSDAQSVRLERELDDLRQRLLELHRRGEEPQQAAATGTAEATALIRN